MLQIADGKKLPYPLLKSSIPKLALFRKNVKKKMLTKGNFKFIVLLAIFFQVATESKAQITLSEKKAPLQQVLQSIKQQSGYDLVYDVAMVKQKGKPVDIEVKNVSVEQALNTVFRNQVLTYKILGKNIISVHEKGDAANTNMESATSLPNEIRGRVTDSAGNPLSGAGIQIKGNRKITTTDDNGFFALNNVSTGQVVVVTYVGYETKEIRVGEGNNLAISLKTKFDYLDSMSVSINTGYQILPKERSAGSFSKPDITIIANRSSSMSILQRLDGLVPGLTINNSPGAGQNPFLIRGLTTVGLQITSGLEAYTGTSRSPLYVVDGLPMDDVSTINPQDVADITVLKDATAASIWGARAANGVIVIVTKKGTKDGKIRVNYNAFVNFQGKPDINYFPVLNSQQFIQAAKDIFDPVLYPWSTISAYLPGASGIAPHELILYNKYRNIISAAQADKSLDSLASINNTDQIKDLWYRNAILTSHTVSVAGGQKNYSFYGSGTFTDNQSNRPGEMNNVYKIDARQDFSLGKRIQLNLITDVTNTVTNIKRNVDIDDRFYPYQLFQDPSGNNLNINYMSILSDSIKNDFQTRSKINLDYNPLDEVNYGYTKSDALFIRNILGVRVKLFDGLSFEGTYGYIKNSSKTTSFDDLKSYTVRSEIVKFTVAPTAASTPVYYLPTNGGTLALTNLNQTNWTVRNQLNYDKAWKGRQHQLNLLLGQEAQEQLGITNTSKVRGYNELLQSYSILDYLTLTSTGIAGTVLNTGSAARATITDAFFGQNETKTRFTSYYANMSYTYNRKYSLNGSFRIDQSNQFGLDKSAQNKPAWSVGGKWLISQERFFDHINWLNSLALRTTYGIAGNAPAPGTATSYDVLASTSSVFLPGGSGLRLATNANIKLSWESTKTLNVGIDFSILKNRIGGSIDLYQKKTNDLLGNLPTNTFTGYSTIIGNIGNLENKGVEFSLNSLNVRGRNFSWSTSVNIAYNKNVLTDFRAKVAATTGNARAKELYVTGYSAFAVFAYQYAGLDNLGDPQIRLADGTVTKTPNISKPGDIKYMGTSQPVWSGGVSNVFNYKSFSLSINTVLNLGHVMRRDVNQFYYGGRLGHSNQGFTTGNISADFANRWKQPGDELITNTPSYVSNGTTSLTRRDVGYYSYADINVVSAAFIKARDITLVYNLPKSLIRKIKSDQISVRAQVSNLMLWKANKDGIDPEFQYSGSTSGAGGGVRYLVSNQGTITFGLDVKF